MTCTKVKHFTHELLPPLIVLQAERLFFSHQAIG